MFKVYTLKILITFLSIQEHNHNFCQISSSFPNKVLFIQMSFYLILYNFYPFINTYKK